jgi:hypothetical protein
MFYRILCYTVHYTGLIVINIVAYNCYNTLQRKEGMLQNPLKAQKCAVLETLAGRAI